MPLSWRFRCRTCSRCRGRFLGAVSAAGGWVVLERGAVRVLAASGAVRAVGWLLSAAMGLAGRFSGSHCGGLGEGGLSWNDSLAVIAGSGVDDVERVFNAEIGRRVRVARVRAELTQELLARKAGLTRGSITNIESGAQAPPPYRLVRLASALGVEPADLLPGLPESGRHGNELPDYLADTVASVASEAFERRARDGQV